MIGMIGFFALIYNSKADKVETQSQEIIELTKKTEDLEKRLKVVEAQRQELIEIVKQNEAKTQNIVNALLSKSW